MAYTGKQWATTADLYDIISYFWADYGADFSGCWYDENYRMTFEEAREYKYTKVLEGTQFKKGDRVLDMGCGWGNFLMRVAAEGGEGMGVTISAEQAKACRSKGLNVIHADCRELEPADLGTFEVVTAFEPIEHFATPADYFECDPRGSRQELVYRDFFKKVHQLLAPNRYFYTQAMLFTERAIEVAERVYYDFESAIRCPKWSDDRIFAELNKFYPNAFLPVGVDQLNSAADGLFSLSEQSNGRKDYIVTINEWSRISSKVLPRKILTLLKLLPSYVFSRDFRIAVNSLHRSNNQESFKRLLIDHERLFYQRIQPS